MPKPERSTPQLTFKIIGASSSRKTSRGNVIAAASVEKPFRAAPVAHFFNLPPLLESFNKAHKTHVKIISPAAAHKMLANENWLELREELCATPDGKENDFYFPVNVLVACEAPGKPLGERIAFNPEFYLYENGVPVGQRKDLCAFFCVPRKYQGLPDVALALPDFSKKDFKREKSDYIIRVPTKRIVPIEGFPVYHTGSYKHHPELILPYGEDTFSDDDLRSCRFTHGPYVGPAIRMVGIESEFELRQLFIDQDWSCDMGLIVEMPESDIAILSKLNIIAGGRI